MIRLYKMLTKNVLRFEFEEIEKLNRSESQIRVCFEFHKAWPVKTMF